MKNVLQHRKTVIIIITLGFLMQNVKLHSKRANYELPSLST